LIHDQRAARIHFKRVITFDDSGVSVCDELGGPDGGRVASLRQSESFTTIHMGSSRYFINQELEEASLTEQEAPLEVATGRLAEGVKLKRSIDFS